MLKKESKCALVTGASRGLGQAFARECASRGMDLVLVALPGSGLPEVARSIASVGAVTVDWLEADLTEEGTVERLAAFVKERGRVIDLLINNAGIGSIGNFEDSAIEGHVAAVRLNTLAIVRLTRFFLDHVDGRAGARILNVASLGAFFPMPTLAVYSATKSFVLTYSLALREELAGSIGVSVLCPNAIRTEIVEDYVNQFGLIARLACLKPERIVRDALNAVELGAAIIIPGRFNRTLIAISRFVPRQVATHLIARLWGGFGEAEQRGWRPANAGSA